MKRKPIFLAAVAALLLAFVVAALLYTAQQEKAAAERAAANEAALLRMHAPTLGPATAKVTIVEFLDPACETCAAFYPMVKTLMAGHPNDIRLVQRYAPFHNGSDKVVAILEAARRQGRFWPTLEALLATQADWSPHHTPQVARVWPHLQPLGLDLEKLAFDVSAPEIAQVIAQDVIDAQTLDVTKTPTFFVNGRPLPSFGFRQLQTLVDEELARP